MSSNLIQQPYPIILNPHGGGGSAKPAANAEFHVGEIDKDPVQYPRADLAYKDESGVERLITSPLYTNNSGAFVVSKSDGTIIQPYMKEGVGYSVLIKGRRGTIYESKNVGDPGNLDDKISELTSIEYKESNGNSAFENVISGIFIDSKVGQIFTCENGSRIKRVSESSPTVASDFVAAGDVFIGDFSSMAQAVEVVEGTGFALVLHGDVESDSTTVDLTKDFIVKAEGSNIKMNCDNIFRPLGAKSIKCYGGKWSVDKYINDRPQIFRNDYTDDLSTRPEVFKLIDVETYNAGAAHVLMNIKDVDSVDVDINVTVISDDNTDQYVSDSTLTGRPVAYLHIEGTSDQSVDIGVVRKQNFNLYNSVFDVHMQTGANEDIAKLSGLFKAGKNGGNSFKNRNLNSAAEVDTFTGGLESQTGTNHFTNVSLKSQTLKGELAPRIGLGGRSPQASNVFLFEPNNVNSYGVQNRCSLSPISGNVILYYGNDNPANQTPFSGMIFPNLDVGENEFGGINPTANSITGNIIHLVTGAIAPSVRVQSIDATNLRGSTLSANVLSGGNDLVFDQRREHQSNVWSGNSIYSPMFTTVGIWRMASAFVGGQNFISSSPDPETAGIPMLTKNVPVVADGQPIRLTLDREIKQGVDTNRSLYLLHIHVKGGARTNYQTFIVSSGLHDDYDSVFKCVDSRIDLNTSNEDYKRCIFEVGYNGSGNIRIKALANYSTSGNNPTTVDYMITPLSMNFPTL